MVTRGNVNTELITRYRSYEAMMRGVCVCVRACVCVCVGGGFSTETIDIFNNDPSSLGVSVQAFTLTDADGVGGSNPDEVQEQQGSGGGAES